MANANGNGAKRHQEDEQAGGDRVETRTWPLLVTVLAVLAVVIVLPLATTTDRQVHQPAGPVGADLPLSVYLPIADAPVVGGGN